MEVAFLTLSFIVVHMNVTIPSVTVCQHSTMTPYPPELLPVVTGEPTVFVIFFFTSSASYYRVNHIFGVQYFTLLMVKYLCVGWEIPVSGKKLKRVGPSLCTHTPFN